MSNRQYVHLAERQTKMEGFCIPVGAIFGRRKINNKTLFWVSLYPSEISLKNESRQFSLWVNSGNDWRKVSASFRGMYEPIRSDMVKICKKINGFPVVEKWQRPVRPVITQADRDAHKLAMEFSWRKVPEPQQGYSRKNSDGTVRDWDAQYMVDGRGYDISWEEKVYPLENYNGLPVYYRENSKPSMTKKCSNTGYDGAFDGIGSTRRDGMKVKQIKCRPGKPFIVE